MTRYVAVPICLAIFCCSSPTHALELLASFDSYSNGPITLRNSTGANGTNVPGVSGTNGFQNYFTSVSFSAGMAGGVLASVAGSTPTFTGYGTANGLPATNGGAYLALTLTRNPTYQNVAMTIDGIWLAPYIQGQGSISSEFHMYSSLATTGTGAGTPTGTWATGSGTGTTNLQLASTGTGYTTSVQTAPAAASYFAFNQLNVIPAGTSGNTFEIRIAPDSLTGNPAGFTLASFNSILNGPGSGTTINLTNPSIFALVTSTTIPVPEPSTYVLCSLCVGLLGFVGRRQKRKAKQAETA